jgi:hypothetical protein
MTQKAPLNWDRFIRRKDAASVIRGKEKSKGD